MQQASSEIVDAISGATCVGSCVSPWRVLGLTARRNPATTATTTAREPFRAEGA